MRTKVTYKEEIKDQTRALYETAFEEFNSIWHFIREAWPMLLLLLVALGVAI